MEQIAEKWHHYRYKNITYLILSLIYAGVLLISPTFRIYLYRLGDLGYIGAFIGGILFVSTFTVSIGAAILIVLTKTLNPVEIGLIAGLGAVVGDTIIFQYVRNRGLVSEIKHFFEYFGGDHIQHLIHTKYFGWSLPVIGALIIISPLPDELGVGLMGISQLKTHQFLILSFILNSVGIFLIVSGALLFGAGALVN